jgi:hypothetical protein
MKRHVKKFLDITGGLAFTFAGSAVVFITLSGQTRRAAMIVTGIAIFIHYVYEMSKGEENAE